MPTRLSPVAGCFLFPPAGHKAANHRSHPNSANFRPSKSNFLQISEVKGLPDGCVGRGAYQNDGALDVQSVYRDCKKIGFRDGDLASVVIETAAVDPASGQDDSAPAYLALADLLWKDGMLSDDHPADRAPAYRRHVAASALGRGGDEQEAARRFEALAKKLAGVASLAVAVTAAARHRTVRFRDRGSSRVPLAGGQVDAADVVAYFTKFRGKSPICEVLDWRKRTIPSASAIEGLSLRKPRDAVIIGAARPDETVNGADRSGEASCRRDLEGFRGADGLSHIPLIRMSDQRPAFP